MLARSVFQFGCLRAGVTPGMSGCTWTTFEWYVVAPHAKINICFTQGTPKVGLGRALEDMPLHIGILAGGHLHLL